MHGSQRVTAEELQSLPRWARLALALRAARPAAACLSGRPEAVTVDQALTLVDQACRHGRADEGPLAEAAAAAYTLTLNVADGPADEDAAILTCAAAHTAAFLAEAATVAPAWRASFLAAESVASALTAQAVARARPAGAVLAALRHDLDQFREVAARRHWGDHTPVPAEFLEGPL
jgi:hypothetical protein